MNAFLDHQGEAEARVVMGAIRFYEYIYEAIKARGFNVVLPHPLNLRALTAGRAKNDRNDAEMLAELLKLDTTPTSYVPPKEVSELRDFTHHRSSLVAVSTTLKNKIHDELARKGTRSPTETSTPFSKKFVNWLGSLNVMTMDGLLGILEIVQLKIKSANDRVEDAEKHDDDVWLLKIIPGVGRVIALVSRPRRETSAGSNVWTI